MGDDSFTSSISASDIIQETVPPEKVSGKIILVGATAAGLKDIRATPFDPDIVDVFM